MAGESSKVRVSSKGQAQARCFREQKAERKAVMSPRFSKESTRAGRCGGFSNVRLNKDKNKKKKKNR